MRVQLHVGARDKIKMSCKDTEFAETCPRCEARRPPPVSQHFRLDSFVMCVCIIATVENPSKQRQRPSCDFKEKKRVLFPTSVLFGVVWLTAIAREDSFITANYVRTEFQRTLWCSCLIWFFRMLSGSSCFRALPCQHDSCEDGWGSV